MGHVNHVAIIMDGNGRWAERRGMPRWRGHEAGAEAVRRVTEAACRQDIPVLTLFAFSSENWRRPANEVNILFSLFRRYLVEARKELVENGVKLSTIGRRDRLSPATCKALEETESLTSGGGRLHLRLAIDYGARAEIAESAKALIRRVQSGELKLEQVNEDAMEQALPASAAPDPDLIIRTAGEQRLSNFLLWQAAYSEFYFTPKLWPDFDESDLVQALADYGSRSRRFGALPSATGTIG